jgi:hypothetical protein
MHVFRIIAVVLLLSGLFVIPAEAAPQPPPEIRLHVRDGVIQISWLKSPDDPLDVAGYEVVRGVFTTGPFQSVCTTVKGAVSCCDRSAQPEKRYYYRVRALGYADAGHSEFTGLVEGTLPPIPVASR